MAEQVTPHRAGQEPPRLTEAPEQRVLCGDAIDVLATLPDATAQTCITSPPYWGLRDYGVSPRVWGGDPSCRHRWGKSERGTRGAAGQKKGGRFCRRCGAWKGSLGLEPDPDLYIKHLVSVLREVRRVLREDGTLWLNLGDSFAANRFQQGRDHEAGEPGSAASVSAALKPKDLVGIPWRVAFALQEDGWWLRSDIVWAKPNVMPESVTDRPTRAHEFVFLLAKSRRYFYDAEAVREPDSGRPSGNGFKRPERLTYGGRGQAQHWVGGSGRNRRSVWTIPTQCFKGAHFATFPQALVEPCLLAGSSPAACSICGAPWLRIVESRRLLDGEHEIKGGWTSADPLDSGRSMEPTGYRHSRVQTRRRTVGWQASCEHDAPGARCCVLDPFAGVGTTGVVAARHGRDFLGVELSKRYAGLALGRVRDACSTSSTGRRRHRGGTRG